MIHNLNGIDVSKTQTVFLDLDGTIAQSGEGCMSAIRYMMGKIGMTGLSDKQISDFVGPAVRVHLCDVYGFSEKEAADAYVHYRTYYDSKGIFENRPYDGIEKVLNTLRQSNKTLYIATLKPEDQAFQILDYFGLRDIFEGIFGARHDLGIFHKEGVLKRAIDIIGHVPANAVMVGDRYHDVLAGKHMGFATIGVTYGYGSYDELADSGCDLILDNVHEITQLLGGNNK